MSYVIITDDGQRITLNQDQVNESGKLQRSFTGGFIEAQTKEILLPEISSGEFELILSFLPLLKTDKPDINIYNQVTGYNLAEISRLAQVIDELDMKNLIHIFTNIIGHTLNTPEYQQLWKAKNPTLIEVVKSLDLYKKLSKEVVKYLFGHNIYEEIFTIENEAGFNIAGTSFSPSGNMLAIGFTDGTANIYNVINEQLLFSVKIGITPISVLTFSLDETKIALGGNIFTMIYDIFAERLIYQREDESYVFALAFSPDGSIIAIGLEGARVKGYNIDTKQKTFEINGLASVISLQFSPDNKNIAVGYENGRAILYDAKSLPLRMEDSWHEKNKPFLIQSIGPMYIKYSNNGLKLGVTSSNGFEVHNTTTKEKILDLSTYDDVSVLAFNQDGTEIMIGGEYGLVLYFDLISKEKLSEFYLDNFISLIEFSSEGFKIATKSKDLKAVTIYGEMKYNIEEALNKLA